MPRRPGQWPCEPVPLGVSYLPTRVRGNDIYEYVYCSQFCIHVGRDRIRAAVPPANEAVGANRANEQQQQQQNQHITCFACGPGFIRPHTTGIPYEESEKHTQTAAVADHSIQERCTDLEFELFFADSTRRLGATFGVTGSYWGIPLLGRLGWPWTSPTLCVGLGGRVYSHRPWGCSSKLDTKAQRSASRLLRFWFEPTNLPVVEVDQRLLAVPCRATLHLSLS